MPIQFKAELKRFLSHGDKTGWTYIIVPQKMAVILKPDYKRTYRVKGSIDEYPIQGVAMIPMGEGNFLIAVNATIRKAIRKQTGIVEVRLEEDKTAYRINRELIACLKDEPEASARFKSLPPSHQRYFSKWIESAKTVTTRTKRIAMTVNAMLQGIEFGEMLRFNKESKRLPGNL